MNKILVSIALVIVSISVMIPIMGEMDFDKKPESAPKYYDDYSLNDAATSASGSLELINIDGHNYLHANDVGNGSYTVSGHSFDVTIQKAPLDIFVALGQSNNAYAYYERALAEPIPPLGTAYYFGSSSAPLNGNGDIASSSMRPLIDVSTGEVNVADKIPAFCAEYSKISGHKIYYIVGAWSGSIIQDWQPGAKCFTNATAIVSSAMEEIDPNLFEVTIRGYTWIQGENNASMSVSEYVTYFNNMNSSILSGGLGIDLDHCFISKVRSNYSGPSEAQNLLSEEPTVTLSSTSADSFTVANHLLVSDGVHYSQLGDNIIGAELGKSAGMYYFPEYSETNSADISGLIQIIPLIVIAAILLSIGGIVLKRPF